MAAVNKELIPIKSHYFMFNAGTGPLVPYLSSFARQLGFTSKTVGIIYTTLPISGLIAKPLFGVLADKYKIQKTLFVLFQIVILITFTGIYFTPEEQPTQLKAQLNCNDSHSSIQKCYKKDTVFDQCMISSVQNDTTATNCRMNCRFKNRKMWQNVCEHWHYPYFCYDSFKVLTFTTVISYIRDAGSCLFLGPSTVMLDEYEYHPACRQDKDYVNLDIPCTITCRDARMAKLVERNEINLMCYKNEINFRLCDFNRSDYVNFMTVAIDQKRYSECMLMCDLPNSTYLMQICESLNAGRSLSCAAPFTDLPKNLTFDAYIKLSKVALKDNCVSIEIEDVTLPGEHMAHFPHCGPKAAYDIVQENFLSDCDIDCDNSLVNDILRVASDSDSETIFTTQFWYFSVMMLVNWIGQAVVVTFADAICFNILDENIAHYGRQRLWGSVGFGLLSLLSGALIDYFSTGDYKDYSIAFGFAFFFIIIDIFVSYLIEVKTAKMSVNILADVGTFLYSLPNVVFLIWAIAVGICTGLLWQFLFWHIEDVVGMSCTGSNHVKTLQGIVSGVQMFGGEIPFMFASGYVLKKIGYINMMSVVMFAFGIRFILYYTLTNAWWIIPIELLQGITFGMFYPTLTSYASVISPSGTETTVQGLVGAVFEGVGSSLGSFIGGILYDAYGGWNTFLWFGIGALVLAVVHVVVQFLLKRRENGGIFQGFPLRVIFGMVNGAEEVAIVTDVDADNNMRLEVY